MTKIETINGKKPHKFFDSFLKDFRSGKISRREFLAYSTSVGVTAATALAFAGVAAEEAEAQTPKRGGTLRVTMNVIEISDPASYEWSEMGNGSRGVLEYLVRWQPDGTFTPMLLESWDLSDDGKIWTLNIRKGVKWNNGDELTSEDIAFNINRWLNRSPATTMQSRFPGMLEEYDTGKKDDDGNAIKAQRGVKGAVKVIDKYTVRLTSNNVDISYIPSIADYPAAIVHRSFEKTGSDFLKQPIGTGPFTLREYKVGERIVKVRRPDGEYWDGNPYLDSVVTIDLKEDPAQVFAAFSTNQVDLAYQIGADQYDRVKSISGVVGHEVSTANTGVIRFHTKTAPFDNADLRRAIMLLSNNAETLAVAHNNAGSVAEHHHVFPGHPEYAKLPEVKRNVEEARKLLKKAGMEGGEVELTAVNSPTWESQACLALASQAKEAGLTINVNILPGDAYWAKWDEWPFSLTAWNGRPLGIQVYNLAYKGGAVWNETAYANPEFDRILEEASGTPDAGARSKMFAKLEKMMQDDAILIQPLWRGIFTATSQRLKGFNFHPAYEQHLEKVWLA